MVQRLTVEKSVLKIKRDSEEVEAGVSTFDELKQFNTIYAITQAYGITPDEAFDMDYGTAFLTLVMKAKEANFAKRMRDVIKRKT